MGAQQTAEGRPPSPFGMGRITHTQDGWKRQEGKDILVYGSGDLPDALMEHDLVDEYRLMVFPTVADGARSAWADDPGRRISYLRILLSVDAPPTGPAILSKAT